MTTPRLLVCGLLLLAGVGCASSGGGPLRPAAVPVPPSQEIEVRDPGQSATGVPAVITTVGDDGLTRVDVPPAVLVHRYYPSGDRSFQGPMLPGGPVVLAVTHPHTMERVYVPLTLPPGAPRVKYAGKSIEYDYGPQSVRVHFGPCKPTVTYSQGIGAVEAVRRAAENTGERVKELADSAGVPQGLQRLKSGTQDVFDGAAERIGRLRQPLPPSPTVEVP